MKYDEKQLLLHISTLLFEILHDFACFSRVLAQAV